MSTSSDGLATRKFMAGIRLWPPASTIASASLAKNFIASSTVLGAWYAKSGGFIAALQFARQGGGNPTIGGADKACQIAGSPLAPGRIRAFVRPLWRCARRLAAAVQ